MLHKYFLWKICDLTRKYLLFDATEMFLKLFKMLAKLSCGIFVQKMAVDDPQIAIFFPIATQRDLR